MTRSVSLPLTVPATTAPRWIVRLLSALWHATGPRPAADDLTAEQLRDIGLEPEGKRPLPVAQNAADAGTYLALLVAGARRR